MGRQLLRISRKYHTMSLKSAHFKRDRALLKTVIELNGQAFVFAQHIHGY